MRVGYCGTHFEGYTWQTLDHSTIKTIRRRKLEFGTVNLPVMKGFTNIKGLGGDLSPYTSITLQLESGDIRLKFGTVIFANFCSLRKETF